MNTEHASPKPHERGIHHKHKLLVKKIFKIVAVIIVALIIFNAGIFFGFRKATFGYKWNDNYYGNFVGDKGAGFPRHGMMMDPSAMHGHGLLGKVVKVNSDSIIIQDIDGAEKIVTVDDDTSVKESTNSIKIADVKVGDNIVVIGAPDDSGNIKAHFIRVIPSVSDQNGVSTSTANQKAK